jgi:hypothetical protein
MRRVPILATVLLGALATGACLSIPADATATILNFDFNAVGSNFVLVSADYPASRAADVNAQSGLLTLPSPLTTTQSALYLSGTNATGALFLMLKKYLPGLPPNATYRAAISVAYASNIQSGCTTGLGPAVFVKAGAGTTEPLAAADAQAVLRMNINKGTGAAPGDFTTLGDIRNGLSGCPSPGTYAIQTSAMQNQAITFTTDGQGGFWLWVATESTAAGRSEVYFTSLTLKLTAN